MENPNLYDGLETHLLSNGLQVCVLQRPVPFVNVFAMVHSGSWDDGPKFSGLAHFSEHMVCEAAGGEVSEVENLFGPEGAFFNALTEEAGTAYYFAAPVDAPSLPDFFSFLAKHCFCGRDGYERVIERERDVIKREFAKYHPSPNLWKGSYEFQQNVYVGTKHAVAPDPLGTLEGIAAVTCDSLVERYDRFHVPSNVTVMCVGGMDTRQVVDMLDQSGFLVEHPGMKRRIWRSVEVHDEPMQNEVQAAVEGTRVGDCVLHGSVMLPNGITDAEMLIYSDFLSTQLLMEIREKRGLSYGAAFDSVNEGYFNAMSLSVSSFDECRLSEVRDVVERVVTEGMSSDKFEMTRRKLILRQKMADRNLESLTVQMAQDLFRFDTVRPSGEITDRLEDARYSMVDHISGEILGPRMVYYAEHT